MSSSFSLNPAKHAPIFWTAFASSLLLFSALRVLPPLRASTVRTEAFALDLGFVQQLSTTNLSYSVIPDVPQTFGERVLPRYLLALGSMVTGKPEATGLTISLMSLVATLAGVCLLARMVLPSREFMVVCGLTTASISGIQLGFSPDPSMLLGSAFVIWAFYFFLSAVGDGWPYRIFLSAQLIGLAAYIRLELAFLWVPMALYLIGVGFFKTPPKAKGLPLVAMALAGIFQMALILWPMMDRNLQLTGIAILPGLDAERVLGVSGAPASFSLAGRLVEGLKILMLDRTGLGVFLGLLWPVGMVMVSLRYKHASAPFVWVVLPFLLLLGLVLLSPVTGRESFRESLTMLTPSLIPLAVYPLAWILMQALDSTEKTAKSVFTAWTIVGGVSVLMALLPTLTHASRGQGYTSVAEGDTALLEWFENDGRLRNASLMTDRPGMFLRAGKQEVFGVRGETDWRVFAARKADGSVDAFRFNQFLKDNEIVLLHLAQIDNPLVEQLRAESNAPTFRPAQITPPHRVFLLQWSEPSERN